MLSADRERKKGGGRVEVEKQEQTNTHALKVPLCQNLYPHQGDEGEDSKTTFLILDQ